MQKRAKRDGIGEKIRALIRRIFGLKPSEKKAESLQLSKASKHIGEKMTHSIKKSRIKKIIKSKNKSKKDVNYKKANSLSRKIKRDRQQSKKDLEKKENAITVEVKAKRREAKEEFKKLFNRKQKQKKERKRKKEASPLLVTERAKIFQKDIDKAFADWELMFPNMNLGSEIINKIKERVYKELGGKNVKREKIEKRINFAMRDAVSSMILQTPDLGKQIKSKKEPFMIIFLGGKGAGKTSSAAKLGLWLKKKNISCLFAAADTSNQQAIVELEKYAKKLDLPITKGQVDSEPAEIASGAKKYAKEQGIQCVLIDTAGSEDENTISSIKKLARIVEPGIKLFVEKSDKNTLTFEQAEYFDKEIGIDGIIITKADIYDEKSTALAISYTVKKPIYFLSIGPEVENFMLFDKENILKKLKLGE